MADYCLIARCRQEDKVDVIEFSENDYLFYGSCVPLRIHSLPEIDYFTTRFSSEESFAKYLVRKGFISDDDVDIFIGSVSKKNNERLLSLSEAIYNNCFTANLMAIIAETTVKNENNGNVKEDLLDDFFQRLYCDGAYLAVLETAGVCYGFKKSALDFFDRIRNSKDAIYDFKAKNKWIFSNYEFLRAIALSYSYYVQIKVEEKQSVSLAHLNYFRNKSYARSRFKPVICDLCDRKIDLYQQSLFDISLDEEEKEEDAVIVKKAEDEIDVQGLSKVKKLLYVNSVIAQLDSGVFRKRNGQKRYSFSTDGLPENVEPRDYNVLTKNIGSTLARAIHYLCFYVELGNEEIENYNRASNDTNEAISEYRNDVSRLLSDSDTLDKTYDWCKTYSKVYVKGATGKK